MHIHFMVNGLGYGHVYRDLPIIKTLSREHDVSVSSFGKPMEILREEGYDPLELPDVGEIVLKEDEIDITKSLWWNLRKIRPDAIKKISNILLKDRPAIVVVDGYPLGIISSKMLRIKTVNITNCTKLSYVFPRQPIIIEKGVDLLSRGIIDASDVIIVPDFAPPFTVSKENISHFGQDQKFKYVGPLSLAKPLKKSRSVLISVGGSGVYNENIRYIQSMIEELGYKTVFSNGGLSQGKIMEVMERAPFTVLHGGHTSLMDAICSQTPIIAVPLKGYTERLNNSKGIESLGLGVVLDEEWITEENIAIAVAKVTDQTTKNNVRTFSRIARKMNGCARVATVIESLKG